MKIALIQMRVGFDKAANIFRALEKIEQAAKMGIDMAVLPEMFCCPYSNKYFRDFGEEEGGAAQTALARLAKSLGIIIVGGSIPETSGAKVYNTSYVYDGSGREIAKHRKIHLFDIDIEGGQRFYESETLSAGDAITTFETKFGKFGLCICFDFRFQEIIGIMALKGAKAVIVPASFNMTTGPLHWELMFRQRAVDNQLFTIGVASARDIGGEYVSYGNSMIVSPWGEIISRCGGDECTQIADLDFSLIAEVRRQLPILSARRTDLYSLSEIIEK